jgi:hypothetical protein
MRIISSTNLLTLTVAACGIISQTDVVRAEELKSTIVTIEEFTKLDHPFYYSIHYSKPGCNTSAVNFHGQVTGTREYYIMMLFVAVDVCTSQVVGSEGRELYVFIDVYDSHSTYCELL